MKHFKISDSYDIERFADNILKIIQLYYKAIEYDRYIGVTTGNHINNDFLQSFRNCVEGVLNLADDLAPAWWRGYSEKVPGFHYSGGNPMNIFGMDNKYNYLIKDEDRAQVLTRRNLIMNLVSPLDSIQIYSNDVMVSLYGDKCLELRQQILAEQIDGDNNEISM